MTCGKLLPLQSSSTERSTAQELGVNYELPIFWSRRPNSAVPTRTSVAPQAMASAKSPLEIMMAANEAVRNTLQKNFFITLIYGVLDSQTGDLSFVRAGHTPGVLIHERKCKLIKPVGIALGVERSQDFKVHTEEEKICLDSGDTMVLYTDGVTDQRDPDGNEFGEERFYDLLNQLSGKTAEEIKGGIIRALAEFSRGTDAVDDTTVLILKWK